ARKVRFVCAYLRYRRPESFGNSPPITFIAGNEFVSFARAPTPGVVVGELAGRKRLPYVKDGIYHGPSGFHHVCTLKESLIPHNSVVEENLIPGIGVGAEIIGELEIHLHGADFHLRAGHLGSEAQRDSFVRRHVHHNLIRFKRADRRIAKEHQRSTLELDGHFSMPRSHPFAGADIEWYACPAPVIDQEPQGHEGLGFGIRRDALFLAVSRHALSVDFTSTVLTAHGITQHVFSAEWLNRVQNLGLFIMHGI